VQDIGICISSERRYAAVALFGSTIVDSTEKKLLHPSPGAAIGPMTGLRATFFRGVIVNTSLPAWGCRYLSCSENTQRMGKTTNSSLWPVCDRATVFVRRGDGHGMGICLEKRT